MGDRLPPGFHASSSQTVTGFPAYVLGEVLRLHLGRELDRWGLDEDDRRAVEWIAAGIRRAGQDWRVARAAGASASLDRERVPSVPQSRPELLTTSQAAKELNVTPSRVKQMCEAGMLGQRPGRDWVISRDEIDAFLADRDNAA